MKQIFGDFIEPQNQRGEYLKIGFQPSSIPLQQRWRNNGLSADFLAGYVSTFFPGQDPVSTARQAEIKDAISFVANELLENAMKFSYASSPQHAVTVGTFLDADVITLYTINCIAPDRVEFFKLYIQKILTSDSQELYFEQLNRNAEHETESTSSGLGFLTMINDYAATLAWKFTPYSSKVNDISVTTMVRLSV